jgi:hypothetical protein
MECCVASTSKMTAEITGFTVETLEYFCFRRFPAKHRTDAHEFLTLTARKPAA